MTRNPFTALPAARILVTGGTGFIGRELVELLLQAGHTVMLYSRRPQQAIAQFTGRVGAFARWDQLGEKEHFDAIINLAGAPVVGPRWSAARKLALLASRVGTTEGLLGWLARARHKPAVLVNGSAIGYYGCRGNEEIDESADSPTGEFQAQLCREWEAAAIKAEAFGVRVVRLRLGLVFGPGGAFPKLLLPFKLGVGGRMGDGRQVMSWVHRDDVLAVIARAIADSTLQGAYNLTAPQALTQGEFAALAAKLLHRPNWFVTPAWLIDGLAGEMGALFTRGQRVVPKRLQEAGYRFAFPEMESALRDQLNSR
ncbi:TIGR01777 family oxidoreductase [Chitinilyticum piscinae]|uniref:TIGR01777 family protein n=1 Tax=Chitinilyticum piscinae TaxID=2866724 RepID=A0A8J7K2F8_9NEIS|nr:TIGR01777 family oxidoreductase [Chitinilyticum piscinae]MBE9609982.1 TIGR01777 family protein [Chitinilyticum piscinae]